MVKIVNKTNTEQMENLINKLIDYAVSFDAEYKAKDQHDDFERGQHLAYYTMLDALKNQLLLDGVELDKDLESIVEGLL